MSSARKLVLMNTGRIQRSLKRIAHEIAENNVDNKSVLFFGINERGYAIAQQLTEILRSVFGGNVETKQLLINNKDNEELWEAPLLQKGKSSFVIVVDDVIFSGKTMFTALKKISEELNPSEIHSAVMVDRGHRKFPIKAEFCGIELPTKLNEHVYVVVEKEQIKQVLLADIGNK
ncbi:MAG: phosphoribosyltransferase family protein [Balneolaceae bacterium]